MFQYLYDYLYLYVDIFIFIIIYIYMLKHFNIYERIFRNFSNNIKCTLSTEITSVSILVSLTNVYISCIITA